MGAKVSVVIANYNYAEFLAAAIDSALALRGPASEVIVVDDGSTDASPAVIAGYGGRIRAIRKPNGGQPSAFNAGFAAASGEVVFFLDADDLLDPQAAAAVLSAWRLGVAKVQFPLRAIDRAGRPTGGVFPDYRRIATTAEIRRTLLTTGLYRCPPTSGNAFARAFLERIFPLPVDLTRAADGLLNVAAPLHGEVVTLKTPLAAYRIHGGNAWAQQRLEPAKFAGFVRDDMARTRFLAQQAAAAGLALGPSPLDRLPLHLGYRLVSRRLAPQGHPLPESVAAILRRAVGATLRAPGLGGAERGALLLWFLGLGLAPRRLARYLASLRYAPERRPAALSLALRRLGLGGAADGP